MKVMAKHILVFFMPHSDNIFCVLVWLWNASLKTQKKHPWDAPPTVPDLPPSPRCSGDLGSEKPAGLPYVTANLSKNKPTSSPHSLWHRYGRQLYVTTLSGVIM